MRPEPLSPYAGAKLMGEYYCQVFSRVYGLESIALRYFNVFGPRQNPSSQYSGVISRFVDALLGEKTPVIYGDGETSRDFTFIANVVNANIKAAQTTKGIGEVMNCANGERISLNDLLNVLKNITGKQNVTAAYEPERKGDVEEGLVKTIDWYKQSRFAV
jgi:UDP-glucose 4-epimerase